METHLPPQPPPDAPAPPPGPEATRSRQVMGSILWLGGISIFILMIIGLMQPVVLRARKASARTEAINNIKQINFALIDFDSDYGRYPDATTIADVQAKTHTTLKLGTSTSNDYFRQLLASGARSEKIFWAETKNTPRKGNDVLGPDALKKGECSFSYIPGLSVSDYPNIPVVMTPMIPGTYRFDSNAKGFGGAAIVLRIDGSAKPETIDSATGEAIMQDGKPLFDPSLPHWHGKRPDLKWPE